MFNTQSPLQIRVNDGNKVQYVAAVGRYWVEVLDQNVYFLQALKGSDLQSKYKISRADRFAGAGNRLVLMYLTGEAFMIWKPEISPTGHKRFCCTIFVNNSKILSSKLIDDATKLAYYRGKRPLLVTLDPKQIKDSNALKHFTKAKWKQIGETNEGFAILEFNPLTDYAASLKI